MQNAVFDRPARNRAHARCTPQLAQPDFEPGLTIRQPFLRPQWHGEATAFRDSLRRNECMFQIAIAPRLGQPDISGAERIAQMKQNRDPPEAGVISRLSPKMAMPFRARPKEAGIRGIVQTGA